MRARVSPPGLQPHHSATTAIVSVLRTRILLGPLAALSFAIGQVFTVASRSWLFYFTATLRLLLLTWSNGKQEEVDRVTDAKIAALSNLIGGAQITGGI